ncbi:MAG: SDR family oxidoreductase [Ardenticatenaceae bacterium]|nr:SDR family oxidoreductase [Ardenticatenaceae bacterium]
MKLEGRVALITGGGSGMGRATALLFATEGARVVIANRTEATGAKTAEEIRDLGGDALFVPTDVTQEADVRRVVAATLERYSRIDILFNNAGEPFDLPLLGLEVKEWDRCFAVNLRSVFLACKSTIPHMRRAGSGVILNNASQIALAGAAGAPAYAAAKAGVVSLTKSLALAHAKDGIRVNCICPGTTWTPLAEKGYGSLPDPQAAIEGSKKRIPLGRLGRADDIAQAALYLVSDAASFVTGAVLLVDGGRMAGAAT